MNRSFAVIILLLLTADCVEPYNFRIENNQPTLVIEAHISNVSFLETKDYPSDGRYFSVKLSYTSDVINIRNEPATSAIVTLFDDQDRSWYYSESPIETGHYFLFDDNFKADLSRKYKLQIQLADGKIYESDFEGFNKNRSPKIGTIDFEEVTKQTYKIQAGETVIRPIDGINVSISLNKIEQKESIYYRWTFEPTWIFTAPLGQPSNPLTYRCWITNKFYLKNYSLEEDNTGGYKKELFFMETSLNDRIYDDMSILITQYAMTEEYFNFWEEMFAQSQKGGLFDPPAFNLKTNFRCLNSDAKVSGYFGVVEEQATRWYFNKDDLSYFIDDIVKINCLVEFQDMGPECFSCLGYPFGESTNVKPAWWK